ncbi:MAG TPA: hypothetical protein VFQ63_03065 [Patescibacteria group bacterium]|nr:hypothetical protein [Patescibacteria group bacterium]
MTTSLERAPQLSLPEMGKSILGPGDPQPETVLHFFHRTPKPLEGRAAFLAQMREGWQVAQSSPVLTQWSSVAADQINEYVAQRADKEAVRDAQLIAAVARGEASIVVPRTWKRPWPAYSQRLKKPEERAQYQQQAREAMLAIAGLGLVGYQKILLSNRSLELDKELSRVRDVMNTLRRATPNVLIGAGVATIPVPLPTSAPLIGLGKLLKRTLAATDVLFEGEWRRVDDGVDGFKGAWKQLKQLTAEGAFGRRTAPQIEVSELRTTRSGETREVKKRYKLNLKGGKRRSIDRMVTLFTELQTPEEMRESLGSMAYYDVTLAALRQEKEATRQRRKARR